MAALVAHRRFSCSENKNLDDFLGYFSNPNENTEIRIAAYLSSMECASLSTYTLVKDVLYKEETNQGIIKFVIFVLFLKIFLLQLVLSYGRI